jgi:hypothetical protein
MCGSSATWCTTGAQVRHISVVSGPYMAILAAYMVGMAALPASRRARRAWAIHIMYTTWASIQILITHQGTPDKTAKSGFEHGYKYGLDVGQHSARHHAVVQCAHLSILSSSSSCSLSSSLMSASAATRRSPEQPLTPRRPDANPSRTYTHTHTQTHTHTHTDTDIHEHTECSRKDMQRESQSQP